MLVSTLAQVNLTNRTDTLEGVVLITTLNVLHAICLPVHFEVRELARAINWHCHMFSTEYVKTILMVRVHVMTLIAIRLRRNV
jgi:hypothetical protein